MKLEWVEIRKATSQDIQETQGSLLYRTVSYPFWIAARALGSAGQFRNKDDLLAWESPLPLRVTHAIQYCLGWKPEFEFVVEKPTLTNGDHYQLTDGVAIHEFFSQHRNDMDGVFSPGKSVIKLQKFISACFPEENLGDDDFIFTATPETTAFLHSCYLRKLGISSIHEYFENIKWRCSTFLNAMNKEQPLNFSTLAPQFFAETFGENLLGNEEIGKELSHLIGPIKRFLVKQSLGKLTPEEAKELREIQSAVRNVAYECLKDEELTRFFNNSDTNKMTEGQKLAFMVVAMIAAQDNTSNLLQAAIYCVAIMNEERLEALQNACKNHLRVDDRTALKYPKELDQLLAEAIRYFPPVPGVARTVRAKNGLCMEYRFKGETKRRKVVFPQGCSLSARIYDAAKNAEIAKDTTLEEALSQFEPFGSGRQRCPGERFATAAIREFLLQLIGNYKVTLPVDYRIRLELQVTAIIKPDVKVILTKLS